jgi:hypothetical protein
MKRRQVLAALGAASSGGALLTGTGAFTSVSADRSLSVSVADDADAFLRLAPCPGSANGDYVDDSNGLLAIDLSGDNGNDPPAGSGVNAGALSVFDNVFEIANQGTQNVCVDFEVDVPPIPEGADVPARYDFGPGDPAVVFYRGASRDEFVISNRLNPDRDGAIRLPLDGGNGECIGFEVRAFGFESGTDLFDGVDLTIRADADADCQLEGGTGRADPTPTTPIAHWSLDDADVEDGTATDVSGNGNDGTVEGPTSVSGAGGSTGNAAAFDGDDDYVDFGTGLDSTIADTDEFTLALWIKTTDTGDDQWFVGTHPRDYNSGEDKILGMENGRLKLFIRGDEWRIGSATINDGDWHHVAGSYDGSAVRLYVDGQLDDSWTIGGIDLVESSTLWFLGENPSRPNTRWYKGAEDEVRIYDRALTTTEIQNLSTQFDP